ncbi:MAG: hypothetical protein HQL50_13235 [Magnetococcales bacterium]|nr:hypothetical protein [Magnetococcales bacterium]
MDGNAAGYRGNPSSQRQSSSRWSFQGRSPSAETGRATTTAPQGVAGGRNFEQVLVALVLHRPGLLSMHEEQLIDIRLAERALDTLLRALIDLADTLHMELPETWPLEKLAPEQADLARRILQEEPLQAQFDSQRIDREFQGCLATYHWHVIRREMQRLEKKSQSHGGFSRQEWTTYQGYRAELARLDRIRSTITH